MPMPVPKPQKWQDAMATWMPRGDPWSSSLSASMSVSDRRRLMNAASSGRSLTTAPRRGTFSSKPGRSEVRQRARRRKRAEVQDPSRGSPALQPLESSPERGSDGGGELDSPARHGAAEMVAEDIRAAPVTARSDDAPVATAAALLAGMPRPDTLWALGGQEIAEDQLLEAALAELRLERSQRASGELADVSAKHASNAFYGAVPGRASGGSARVAPIRAQRVLTEREHEAEMQGWGKITPDTPPNYTPPKSRTPDDLAAAVVGVPPPEAELSPPQATLASTAERAREPAPEREREPQLHRQSSTKDKASPFGNVKVSSSSAKAVAKKKRSEPVNPGPAQKKLGPKTPKDSDRASFLDAPEWDELSRVPGAEEEVDDRPTTSVLEAAQAAAMKALGETSRARQFQAAAMAVGDEELDTDVDGGDENWYGGTGKDGDSADDGEVNDDAEEEDADEEDDEEELANVPDEGEEGGMIDSFMGGATLKTWGRSKVRERVKARASAPRQEKLSNQTARVAAKYTQQEDSRSPALPAGMGNAPGLSTYMAAKTKAGQQPITGAEQQLHSIKGAQLKQNRSSDGGAQVKHRVPQHKHGQPLLPVLQGGSIDEGEDSSPEPSPGQPQYRQGALSGGEQHVTPVRNSGGGGGGDRSSGDRSSSGGDVLRGSPLGAAVGPSPEAAARNSGGGGGARPQYRRRRQPLGGAGEGVQPVVRRIESTVVQ